MCICVFVRVCVCVHLYIVRIRGVDPSNKPVVQIEPLLDFMTGPVNYPWIQPERGPRTKTNLLFVPLSPSSFWSVSPFRIYSTVSLFVFLSFSILNPIFRLFSGSLVTSILALSIRFFFSTSSFFDFFLFLCVSYRLWARIRFRICQITGFSHFQKEKRSTTKKREIIRRGGNEIGRIFISLVPCFADQRQRRLKYFLSVSLASNTFHFVLIF